MSEEFICKIPDCKCGSRKGRSELEEENSSLRAALAEKEKETQADVKRVERATALLTVALVSTINDKDHLLSEQAAVIERAREIAAEFRRCVDSEKKEGDHSDENESCEDGMCYWVGDKMKELAALPAPQDAQEK